MIGLPQSFPIGGSRDVCTGSTFPCTPRGTLGGFWCVVALGPLALELAAVFMRSIRRWPSGDAVRGESPASPRSLASLPARVHSGAWIASSPSQLVPSPTDGSPTDGASSPSSSPTLFVEACFWAETGVPTGESPCGAASMMVTNAEVGRSMRADPADPVLNANRPSTPPGIPPPICSDPNG
eukprot:3082402-Rhodomonas_salina.2